MYPVSHVKGSGGSKCELPRTAASVSVQSGGRDEYVFLNWCPKKGAIPIDPRERSQGARPTESVRASQIRRSRLPAVKRLHWEFDYFSSSHRRSLTIRASAIDCETMCSTRRQPNYCDWASIESVCRLASSRRGIKLRCRDSDCVSRAEKFQIADIVVMYRVVVSPLRVGE